MRRFSDKEGLNGLYILSTRVALCLRLNVTEKLARRNQKEPKIFCPIIMVWDFTKGNHSIFVARECSKRNR